MKKILIFMAGFFPGKDYGGPPVSVDNFCSLLDEYHIYIVTTDHDNNCKARYEGIKTGWNSRENCKVLYLADKEFKYSNFLGICKIIKPDWIYLQGLFQPCIMPILCISKREKIRTLLATRGELCEGAFKKKAKKLPYIALLKALHLFDGIEFQATSNEEKEAIHYWLKADMNRIHYLQNIPSKTSRGDNYIKHKKTGEVKLIFLSRIVPKKNLHYAVKCLEHIGGSVIFDIYGAIEDNEYWSKCKKAIDRLPSNISVNYRGAIEHNQVMGIFSQYDAFLFPTLSENYGHVIVEALLSGCPVIISTETPWRNLRKNNAGWDIDLSNNKLFEDAINTLLLSDEADMKQYRTSAKAYIAKKLEIEKIKSSYKEVFENL